MRSRALAGRAVGAGCILAATVGLAVLLFPASPAVAQLTFSQATRDRDLYAKNPGFYYKEPGVPGQPNAPEIYVAKRPAVSLSLDEILAVVVDREPVLPNLETILGYLKDRQAWEPMRGHYALVANLRVGPFLTFSTGRVGIWLSFDSTIMFCLGVLSLVRSRAQNSSCTWATGHPMSSR